MMKKLKRRIKEKVESDQMVDVYEKGKKIISEGKPVEKILRKKEK